MTDLDRIRSVAMLLPETEERAEGAATCFAVAGADFAKVADGRLAVKDERGGWSSVEVTADGDWTLIEDRIARGWELTAPRRLLEAGGR